MMVVLLIAQIAVTGLVYWLAIHFEGQTVLEIVGAIFVSKTLLDMVTSTRKGQGR